MRSLAIGSNGPPLLQRPATFGKPPPLGIQRPQSISRSAGSVGLKQEWDNPCTTWKVNKEDLEQVPDDFPLERTHRYLHNVEAPEVATRISDALRCHSIQSEFKAKPPKAKCKTLDFVSFRIRLYAGDESGSPVVVEVQRRSGPSSCFMHACRAILDAAEGKATTQKSEPRKMPPFMKKPIGQMKCLQDVAVVSDDEGDTAATALKDCVSMIRNQKRDSNVLGLENLCALTDPIKTKPSLATQVAKSVVFGHDNVDIREDIGAMIERDVFSAEEEDIALSNHADLMRQLALTVFANSLALCAKDGSLAGADGEQSWFIDNLLPSLVAEIKRASFDACSATQASMCVNSFASSSSMAKEYLMDQGVVAALRKSNEYGSECNKLLADETERCLKLFA
eukprot:CAMPEP_0172472680 /NCGR_PEP_ID=MMETSP1065-20121228/68465_1 /TAXON_ID=265537 /ORGANISM="Amphiprora paludosa, Strain CCMP125" /LENGTH=394 /DNA_ID=CAMNT_0013230833 /DNA_START=817 /DNA_END=2001 /DNA_ORIENTATION=+